MSHPNYGPPVGGFSPLGGEEHTLYRSPASYQQPFPSYDTGYHDHGDLGGGIEMEQQRPYYDTAHSDNSAPYDPAHPDRKDRMYSTSSTVFPSDDSQSFLHDPMNHLDTFHMSNSYQPYKDNTGRQLRHIFISSTSRWFITAALCGGYILSTRIWQNKGSVDEGSKRVYNTITTAISIALGLNIASAFKDMALNMRWPILHARKRNLVELDLLLNCDSLTKLAKLALVTKRPVVIIGCILWLLINLLAQAGIAMVSLTYGFDPDLTGVLFQAGNVSIPDMTHFFPQGEVRRNPSVQDEEYMAHVFGESAYNYGINTTDGLPAAGTIYQPQGAMLYWSNDSALLEFVFSDSPTGEYLGTYSVYTARSINVTYVCDSHKVTKGGSGNSSVIVVDGIGAVSLSTVLDSTTYFTNKDHNCESGNRCSVVEAFESSDTDPWYYKCNITMGYTQDDPKNVSYISDDMAKIATASIAQIGYTDADGQAAQIYPRDSPWGLLNNGSTDEMGWTMGLFALATIAGASIFNPLTEYDGQAPSGGVYLHLGHPNFFYLIIGLICGCHLLFCLVVAILANRVMVGPDGHLSMSLLLKPIADALEGVSGGKENKAFRDAKRNTTVKYEKGRHGRWILNMKVE